MSNEKITFAGSDLFSRRDGTFIFRRGVKEVPTKITPLLGGGVAVVTGCKTVARHSLRVRILPNSSVSLSTYLERLETIYYNGTKGTLDLSAFGLGQYQNCVLTELSYDSPETVVTVDRYGGSPPYSSASKAYEGYMQIADLVFTELPS